MTGASDPGPRREGVWTPHPWVTAAGEGVRFGVFGGPFEDPDRLRIFVRSAEELGADSYWIPDHPTFNPDWATTLAALAVTTRRIWLGPLVSCVAFRPPFLLARHAADVDILSGGRLVLGLGIGHHEPEFREMGIAFPPVAERQTALADKTTVVRRPWDGSPVSFDGAAVRLEAATLRNVPVQVPGVPLLIAGGGERTTLRLVAEHADAANFAHGSADQLGSVAGPDDVRRKLGVLRAHCGAIGRPFESVLATHVTLRFLLAADTGSLEQKRRELPPWVQDQFPDLGFLGTPDTAVRHFQALVDAGLSYFILRIWEDDIDSASLFAREVLPFLRPAEAAPTTRHAPSGSRSRAGATGH